MCIRDRFHILELDDSYTAGSSIMPQKKNPCVAELARGRTGRIFGALIQFLTMTKGIPMGYNRDLQEDKPPLWNTFKVVEDTLTVMAGMVDTMKINKQRLAELSGANFTTATELANHLVREHGLTFRQCHHIVGNLVGELHRRGKNFMDFDDVHDIIAESGVEVGFDEMRQIFDPKNNIKTYKSLGSTSPREVSAMITEFKRQTETNLKKAAAQRKKIDDAKRLTEHITAKVLSGSDIKNIKIR